MNGVLQDKPVRVGWIVGPATVEKQASVLSSLTSALAREGFQIVAFCPEGIDVSAMGLPHEQIRRYVPPRRFWPIGSTDRRLSDAVEAADVDVLHALEDDQAAMTARAAERVDRPFLVSVHRLRQLRVNRGRKGLLAVLAANERIRDSLEARRGLDGAKLRVLRPGLAAAAEPHGLDRAEREVAILADGHDGPREALEAVVRAFARLRGEGLPGSYFVINSGRHERILRRLAESLGLRQDVTFVSPQLDFRATRIVQSADVYLSATALAEIDYCCLAAMAAGVPVVAARGGCSDFLHDGRTATLFTAGDVEDLAARLGEILLDPSWAKDRAASALQHLRVYHNPVSFAAELAGLYRRAATEEPPVADASAPVS